MRGETQLEAESCPLAQLVWGKLLHPYSSALGLLPNVGPCIYR